MSKISVNLIDDALAVPNTGGSLTGESNINDVGIIGVSVLVVVLAILAMVVVFSLQKKKRHAFSKAYAGYGGSMKISKNTRKIIGIFVPIFILIGFALTSVKLDAEEPELASAAGGRYDLSIKVDDVEIEAALEDGKSTFAVASNTVTVNAGTASGYLLTVSADKEDLMHEKEEAKISGMEASEELSVLGENTWGIALEKPESEDQEVWQAVPVMDTVLIKDTKSSTTANDETKVYYGVKVNSDLPTGVYSGTLNYQAVANVLSGSCSPDYICYDDNGANSITKMADQNLTNEDKNNHNVVLWASNFKREGYGFAGWNTKADGTGVSFGPNERVEGTEFSSIERSGLVLYAMWVASAGDMQGWTGCRNLSVGDVTALKDKRDNDVYAVAKLADGNCWMIENLRLDTAASTDASKAEGFGEGFLGLANPETSHFTKDTTANSLYNVDNIPSGQNQGYRFPRYNNANTRVPVSVMYNANDNVYAYGNYYTWSAAKANIEPLSSFEASNAAQTSICPKSWWLPYGSHSEDFSGDFYWLGLALEGPVSGAVTPSEISINEQELSYAFRIYPNNFIYSGYIGSDGIESRGSSGNYWSATTSSVSLAYRFYINSSQLDPATESKTRAAGRTVRCVMAQND